MARPRIYPDTFLPCALCAGRFGCPEAFTELAPACGMAIDYIDDYRPHKVSELICVKCGKRFIGCRPVGLKLKDIDCEDCGPGYVIETGEVFDDE